MKALQKFAQSIKFRQLRCLLNKRPFTTSNQNKSGASGLDNQQNKQKESSKNTQTDKLNTMDKTFTEQAGRVRENINKMNHTVEDLIIADHKDILTFLDKFNNSSNNDEALKWLRQFIWDLARHSIAEEIIVYPLFDKKIPNGRDIWNKAMDEHRKLKVLLKEIEKTTEVSSIKSKIKEVEDVLKKHIEYEEKDIFPLFKRHVSEEERISAGNTFLRRKMIVPSRPHPQAPDSSPTLEALVGLFIAPVDKFKDIFYAKFPDQEEVNNIKKDHLDNVKH